MAPRIADRPRPTRLDARRILAECGRDVVLHTAVTVLMYTGIRVGELTALTIHDYDPATRTLAVGTLRHPRRIAIAPSAAAALDAYLGGEETSSEEPLIMGLRKEWMYPLLREAAQRAGVEAGVHDLRRAAMTAVIETGCPAREIQEYFGVSAALSSTDLAPLREGWDRDVADVLERAFSPGA